MSLADKVAGILKGKEIQEEHIVFDDVDSCITHRLEEEEEKILAESAEHLEGISECMKELSLFLERLKEMEREEMFKKLDMIVRNSQKRFSASLKNVVTRIHVDVETFNELQEFYQEMTDALQQIHKLNRMHGKYLYYAFSREMKPFTKTTKVMAVYHQYLGKLLQSEGKNISRLLDIRERVDELRELEKEVVTAERKEREIQKDSEAMKKEIKQLEEQITTIKSSKEYQTLVRFKEHQKELADTLKLTEREIYNILHPLDRDFRKFKRQVELGNFPFNVQLLDEYEKLTERFLMEEEGYPKLKKIAGKMEEALHKKVIKEKGRKKKKVLDILQLILDDGLLELQQKYHRVEAEIDVEPTDDIMRKIEEVERKVEEGRKKIEDFKTKRKELLSRKEDTKGKIDSAKEEIREKCSKVGIQIE